MKTIKLIPILLKTLLLQLIFVVPRIIIFIVNVLISILTILKNTLTYLIEQIKCEVFK